MGAAIRRSGSFVALSWGGKLTDPRDEVAWERSPAVLAQTFPGSRGAIYGASSNSARAAFVRPSNEVEHVRGLFLASGGAHPGGGLPLAALSGQAAARGAATALGARLLP